MIKEVARFKKLLAENFELDDFAAIDIVIAAAVSHKLPKSEMLWLRIIGSSGSGKTTLLRTLSAQDGYCSTMESITPSAIRGGYVSRRMSADDKRLLLLTRIDGTLVITKEFATMLTKDLDAQREVFGLLRAVHDGELDADYGSEQGHLHQEASFDWILGTTQFVERQRQLETLLGSRFIDLRWGRPIEAKRAINKAVENDGELGAIGKRLASAMTDIILNTVPMPKPDLPYLADMADLAARLRTPVERDTRTNEVYDIPDIELGTRFGQATNRIARGLMMMGVAADDIKQYIVRLVLDSMSKKRRLVIEAWLNGCTKQTDIAAYTQLSTAYVSRIIEDLRLLGWQDEMLDLLRADKKPALVYSTVLPGVTPDELLKDLKDVKRAAVIIKEGWDIHSFICPGCGDTYKLPYWNVMAKEAAWQGSRIVRVCETCQARDMFSKAGSKLKRKRTQTREARA